MMAFQTKMNADTEIYGKNIRDVSRKKRCEWMRRIAPTSRLYACSRYSFGVHPVIFLNSRLRWCGYWKPTS